MASATARVEVDINWGTAARVAVATSHEVANNAANKIQARARRFAPFHTGFLRESILVAPVEEGLQTVYRVAAHAPYAEYQEHGTGPIFARPGGFLVWRDRSGHLIFAKRTSGVPATHFMLRAYEETSLLDFL